jgi:hypothetical protein
MNIEPASSELDFVTPVVTAPLQPPTVEKFKGRLPDSPAEIPEVDIDDEEPKVDGRKGHGGLSPRRRESSWPRVMAMYLKDRFTFELHRGPITQAQLTDLVNGLDSSIWNVVVWDKMPDRAGMFSIEDEALNG